MTNSQKKKIEQIMQQADKEFIWNDNYECKSFEIVENKYFVSIFGEYGMKNDEHTLGSILCREKFHLFVYKGGRVTYPISKKLKNGAYKHYHKELKRFSSLLGVSIEQK